jgi:hypothetical protein
MSTVTVHPTVLMEHLHNVPNRMRKHFLEVGTQHGQARTSSVLCLSLTAYVAGHRRCNCYSCPSVKQTCSWYCKHSVFLNCSNYSSIEMLNHQFWFCARESLRRVECRDYTVLCLVGVSLKFSKSFQKIFSGSQKIICKCLLKWKSFVCYLVVHASCFNASLSVTCKTNLIVTEQTAQAFYSIKFDD